MDITLGIDDLKDPEEKINASQVTFNHLTPQAQTIVLVAGKACWYSFNKDTHNLIYPPNDWNSCDLSFRPAESRPLHVFMERLN